MTGLGPIPTNPAEIHHQQQQATRTGQLETKFARFESKMEDRAKKIVGIGRKMNRVTANVGENRKNVSGVSTGKSSLWGGTMM